MLKNMIWLWSSYSHSNENLIRWSGKQPLSKMFSLIMTDFICQFLLSSTFPMLVAFNTTEHASAQKVVQSILKHYENTPIQIYWKFYNQKRENFQIKNSDIFHISAQNIGCGYLLKPPRRGGSKEYPQSMFWAEIRKIMYTPVNPSFTI